MSTFSLTVLAVTVLLVLLHARTIVRGHDLEFQSKLYDSFFRHATAAVEGPATPEIVVAFMGLLGGAIRSPFALPMLFLSALVDRIRGKLNQPSGGPLSQAVESMPDDQREAVHKAIAAFLQAVSTNGPILGRLFLRLITVRRKKANNHKQFSETVVEDVYGRRAEFCAA